MATIDVIGPTARGARKEAGIGENAVAAHLAATVPGPRASIGTWRTRLQAVEASARKTIDVGFAEALAGLYGMDVAALGAPRCYVPVRPDGALGEVALHITAFRDPDEAARWNDVQRWKHHDDARDVQLVPMAEETIAGLLVHLPREDGLRAVLIDPSRETLRMLNDTAVALRGRYAGDLTELARAVDDRLNLRQMARRQQLKVGYLEEHRDRGSEQLRAVERERLKRVLELKDLAVQHRLAAIELPGRR